MSGLTAWLNSPLGPLTETAPGLTSMLTPSGTLIGFRPILLTSRHLPNVGDYLAAHAPLLRLVAGHDADRGGQDRRTHAAHHARDLPMRDVATPAGPRDPAQAGHHRSPPARVLQLDPDDVPDRSGLDREVVDVALLLQDPGHLALQPRRGDLDVGMLRVERIAHAGEVVGYRVGEHQGHRQAGSATSWTWSSRGCSPCGRVLAGTAGRGRTCESRRAADRSAGTDCRPGSCTWARAPVELFGKSLPWVTRLIPPRRVPPPPRVPRPPRPPRPPRDARASRMPPGSPPLAAPA